MDAHQTLIALLIKHYRQMTRGPYGVAKAWEEAEKASETSLERILQDESKLAWLVHFAARKTIEQQRGFSGKSELIRLLDNLGTNSIEHQRAFAKQLALAMETEEANGSIQGTKRRRITIESPIEASVRPTTTTNNTDIRSIDAEHDVSEQIPCQLASKNNVYIGAPLSLAQELFDEKFWDVIERIPSTKPPLADISMVFQQGHIRENFGCQMEIGIAQEKVANIAFQYFNVVVEDKNGVRSARFAGGGKIEPDPSVKLRDCRLTFFGMFRGDLYDAACASPLYQRGKSELRTYTDSVSLGLSNQANEGGKIIVYLGEWMGLKIKTRLYG